MPRRNTKEIILLESLKLFADKGYDGVTVRDIAAKVGIRQSSLYKHFTSKREIFDTLVDEMQSRFLEVSTSLQLPNGELADIAKEYADRGKEFLVKISSQIFHFYLQDSYASQFRKMLTIEKYKNEDIDRIYREVYIDTAISYQTALFKEMIRQGLMQNADPQVMAIQFFAPIFLLLNKYDGIQEREDEALSLLKNHIEQFDMIYSTGRGRNASFNRVRN